MKNRVYLGVFVVISLTALFLFGLIKIYSFHNSVSPESQNSNFHYSYFSQPQFFEDAYKQAELLPSHSNLLAERITGNIRGILVNHHLLASNFIAEAFNVVATNAPVTVLLISPNHFDAGKGNVITSSATWKTPYGNLEPDQQLINQLTTKSLASVEENPFEQEHGISGIVAFIKKSLPNAKVVPLIFRNRMTVAESQKLADEYHSILNADKSARYNTLIVGSFDFSHYLTSNAADFHDRENLVAVENFDFPIISRLDIDSRPGLAFYLELLKNSGNEQFHLLENSNSGKLSHQDILETTSYITGYFTKGAAVKAEPNTLLSLGDIEPSAEVLQTLNRGDFKFSLEYLERLLSGQQTTVARLSASSSLPRLLVADGINRIIVKDETVNLGNIKIAYINNILEAHQAIDNGADVAIANSNNFKIEQYKNKLIFYGQGNFLTSQTLKQNSTSLALGFVYQNNSFSVYILPAGFKDGKGKLLIGQENGKVLSEIAGLSQVTEDTKKQIQSGLIIINNYK